MTEKKTKTRPYHLTRTDDEGAVIAERIVRATSQQQALFHVARTEWNVGTLDVPNAIRLSKAGVNEEVAGEVPPENQQALPLGDGTTAVE